MALKKTQLLDITSVTGIATPLEFLTVGVTETAGGVGIASTTYVKNIIIHNTGLGTARVSAYINPNTTPVTGYGVTENRFLRLDVAPNETTFFESTYPIVLTNRDSLSVEVNAPDSGGTGIGSILLSTATLMSDYGCQWRHGCSGLWVGRTGLDAFAPPPPPAGLTATGGVISDYEVSNLLV